MSGVYTPTVAENETFTAVAGGDALDASSVRVWLEGEADDAVWSKEGGEWASLNWSNGGATTHNLKRAAYFAQYDAWFAVGDGGTNFLEVSYDGGRSWTDLAADLATAKTLVDVTVSPFDGWAILMTSSRDTYKGTHTGFGAYSWALTANALTAAPSGGAIEYEPTSGLFVACYRVGASGHKLDTSPDGVTWTARALPVTWTGFTGTFNPQIGAVAGRAIAIFADASSGSPLVRVVYSTNGTTYTSATATSVALSAAEMTAGARLSRPVYDANAGLWWFALSGTSVDKTEIFASADGGATWAIVATLSAKEVEIQSAAMIGPVWSIVTTKGRILVSKDRGASWRWVANNAGTAGSFSMRGGGGGALVLNSSDKTTARSLRAGRTPGVAV